MTARLLVILFLSAVLAFDSDTPNEKVSGPPSGLPVKKILVHGRPVFVRQMFLNPQRPQTLVDEETTVGEAEQANARLKRHGWVAPAPVVPAAPVAAAAYSAPETSAHVRRRRFGIPPPVAPVAAAPVAAAYAASETVTHVRRRRFGFPPPAAPAAAPCPTCCTPTAYSPYPSADQSSACSPSASYAYAPAYAPVYQSVAVAQPAVAQAVGPAVAAPVFAPPPAPLPQPLPPQPLPPQIPLPEAPQQPAEPLPRPDYPLPSCYTNNDGFMCCNSELDDIMDQTFQELRASRPDWSSCNIDQLAFRTQKNAEQRFNTTFEVLAGIGDFASRSHFWSDLICKSVQDGKYVLIYATPHADAEDYDALNGQGGEQNGAGGGQGGGQYGEDTSGGGGGGSQGPSTYNEGPPQQKEGYQNFNFRV